MVILVVGPQGPLVPLVFLNKISSNITTEPDAYILSIFHSSIIVHSKVLADCVNDAGITLSVTLKSLSDNKTDIL